MEDHGLRCAYIDLSNIIPLDYDFNNGFDDNFYKFLSKEKRGGVLNPTDDDVIPVLTGYFGVVPRGRGLLNSEAEGYTDLCAAFWWLAGVQADRYEYGKVDKPVIPQTLVRFQMPDFSSVVTPEEQQNCLLWIEVIHPFTMEQVIKAEITSESNVDVCKLHRSACFPDINIARGGNSSHPLNP